jgi:hypothetical protein
MSTNKQVSRMRLANTLVAVMVLAYLPGFGQASGNDKASQITETAPIPPQILAAKKIFIANDPGPNSEMAVKGNPDRAYTDFYFAMKAWGYYEVVGSPSDADLIFEIRLMSGRDVPTQFRLTMRDPKTNVLVWRLYQPIKLGLLPGNQEKNFDLVAAPQLITKIATLINAPPYPLAPQK